MQIKQQPPNGYAVMSFCKRVIMLIGEDIRRNGLTPEQAIDLAQLLCKSAEEADAYEPARASKG